MLLLPAGEEKGFKAHVLQQVAGMAAVKRVNGVEDVGKERFLKLAEQVSGIKQHRGRAIL